MFMSDLLRLLDLLVPHGGAIDTGCSYSGLSDACWGLRRYAIISTLILMCCQKLIHPRRSNRLWCRPYERHIRTQRMEMAVHS